MIRRRRFLKKLVKREYSQTETLVEVTDGDPFDDNLIGSSLVAPKHNGRPFGHQDNLHVAVIDLDVPAALLPSTTEGHFHLFIEKAITWDQYMKILNALAEAGIVEHQYVNMARKEGQTFVRSPGVKKGQPLTPEQEAAINAMSATLDKVRRI